MGFNLNYDHWFKQNHQNSYNIILNLTEAVTQYSSKGNTVFIMNATADSQNEKYFNREYPVNCN